MDIDVVLEQLQKMEQALECGVCSKKCINPVKIKVCGHYYCYKCFKVKDHICPKCKTYYGEREIDYNNIAKESDGLLLELKQFLLEPDTDPIEDVSKDSTINCNIVPSVDNFVYDNKIYHLNYIDNIGRKVNAKGETPLHVACKKKKLNEVISLIKNNNDLNAKDFAGWAPLHEAVETGSVQIVETLLENGALINIPGVEYVSPLHKAVTLENNALIEILLRYKADTEAIDYFGRKPVDCTRKEDINNVFTANRDIVHKTEELFCGKKISVYFYYTEETYKQKLMKSKLVKVIKEYDAKKVTHFIIRKTHKLSIKIMIAMLDGCFILPQEWVANFLKNNYFVSVPDYTFISKPVLNDGIRKAILNSLLKLPKLFDGIYFFIHGHNNPVEVHGIKLSKDSISSLITSGGGKILHRAPTPSTCEGVFNYPYHSNRNGKVSRCCHYLIYEERSPPTLQYQMAEIKHRPSKWLVDCIINFTIHD